MTNFTPFFNNVLPEAQPIPQQIGHGNRTILSPKWSLTINESGYYEMQFMAEMQIIGATPKNIVFEMSLIVDGQEIESRGLEEKNNTKGRIPLGWRDTMELASGKHEFQAKVIIYSDNLNVLMHYPTLNAAYPETKFIANLKV